MGAAGQSGESYVIDQSIRFNDNDSPTLQRTFGSTGGNTWTFSCWMKRGNLGKNLGIFYALPSVNSGIGINPSDQIIVADDGASNGPYMDGYLSEINFVDGTELSPTDFGETNDDGVWVPKAYAGAYGDNGFYLTGATAADLGEDFSGNNNDFTSSGLTTADQMLDTPTNNYPTYNSISTLGTLSDGNLVLSIQDYACPITQSYPTSGIWQTDFELDVVSGTDGAGVGVLDYSLFKYRTNQTGLLPEISSALSTMLM